MFLSVEFTLNLLKRLLTLAILGGIPYDKSFIILI